MSNDTPRFEYVNSPKIEVQLLETMGSDRAIAESAWTSSYDRSRIDIRSDDDVARVVRMLAAEGHGVPFEAFVCRFWMRIPIYIDRQIVKYRIQSQSGMSARYRTMPREWQELPIDALHILDAVETNYARGVYNKFQSVSNEAYDLYEDTLARCKTAEKSGLISNDEYKRVREVLRGVLPLAQMTETSNILNLRSMCNLWRQRLSHYAQPEIRQVAQLMLDLVKQSNRIPVAINELEKSGWLV